MAFRTMVGKETLRHGTPRHASLDICSLDRCKCTNNMPCASESVVVLRLFKLGASKFVPNCGHLHMRSTPSVTSHCLRFATGLGQSVELVANQCYTIQRSPCLESTRSPTLATAAVHASGAEESRLATCWFVRFSAVASFNSSNRPSRLQGGMSCTPYHTTRCLHMTASRGSSNAQHERR